MNITEQAIKATCELLIRKQLLTDFEWATGKGADCWNKAPKVCMSEELLSFAEYIKQNECSADFVECLLTMVLCFKQEKEICAESLYETLRMNDEEREKYNVPRYALISCDGGEISPPPDRAWVVKELPEEWVALENALLNQHARITEEKQ